ncbi:MAG: hypothetical protein AB7O96_06500 [Pseudobdellovibrionaceae bacterium]
MNFNKSNNVKKALERLNSKQRTRVEKLYPVVNGVKGAAAEELERIIVSEYLTMNKPRIFQVFQTKTKFSDVKTRAGKLKDKYGLLEFDDHNQYTHQVTVDTPSAIEISFLSFKKILIRPKNEDGEFIGTEKEPETLFYILSVEFLKFGDSTLVVIKYPPLVMETGKLHDYEPEANFVTSWINDKLKVDPSPVSLKAFYEKIDTSVDYQRSGFKARGLSVRKSLIDASFGIDMTKNPNPPKVYQEADEVLQEEAAKWVLAELNAKDTKRTFSEPQKRLIEKTIEGMKFAERYFNLIHTRCKFGRGYLKYEKKKVRLNYTLEYEEDRFPLIRCRRQGWESFEPAFTAIKKFITES